MDDKYGFDFNIVLKVRCHYAIVYQCYELSTQVLNMVPICFLIKY